MAAKTKGFKFRHLVAAFLLGGLAGGAGSYLLWLRVYGTSPLANVRGIYRPGPDRQAAEPLDVPGLENFYKVSDGLYRGAQPTKEGLQQLAKMGIKTVVNLRKHHCDRDLDSGVDLLYGRIPMDAWGPKEEHVVRWLQFVGKEENRPIFVHCKHGSDRTGLMCAIYRVVYCGWSREEAIAEMTQGGFGYHGIWKGLVDFLRELDIEEMKRRADMGQ